MKDDKVTVYSIFRKITLKKNEIELVKPLVNPNNFTGGGIYRIKLKINNRKKTILLQNKALQNIDEFIRMISTKIS